jgi:hypothetical protein
MGAAPQPTNNLANFPEGSTRARTMCTIAKSHSKRTPTHDLAGAKKAERDEASSCQAKGVELGAEGT